MKRLCLHLLFLTSTIVVFSQSLYDLDNNPSFKGITLGSPISKYSDILEFKGVNKGLTAYQINNLQYYSIFNIKMDNALVLEKNGMVWSIFLQKSNPAGTFSPKEIEALKSSLVFKYGSPNVDLTDFSGTPSIAGYRWLAQRVVLDIAYLFHGTFEGSELHYYLYLREDDY